MRMNFRTAVSIGTVLLLLTGIAYAQKSAPNDNNGFPSGPHYNLNIIGKKATFACNPDPEIDPNTGLPIYGNVVFVPESGNDTQIMLISGSTKGKTASTFTELRVIDPCAGFDESPAQVQLPPNAAGYRVYARALAKPTSDPSTPTMTLTPGLAFVEDETSTDLVYIGLVTPNGFVSAYQELTRTKGKSTAVDISQMFMWAGTVCYQSAPTDEFGVPLADYPGTPMCWVDVNGNGIYDYGDTFQPPVDNSCTAGSLVTLFCHTYDTPQWVFNIADLVQYFWSVDTTGSKLVQIRFYPN